MTLREKGMKIWETLRPEQKKKAMIAGIVAAIIICALIFYKTTHEQGIDQSKKMPEKKREIALDKGTLEKSLYNESTKQMGDMQSEVKDLQEQLKKVIADKESNGSDQNDAKADLSRTWAKQSQALADKKKDPRGQERPGFPPLPPPANGASVPLPPGVPPSPAVAATAPPSKPEIYGDIQFVSQSVDNKSDKQEEAKKKDVTKIYLPPSFMEATLLSGMYAPTSEGGKGSPMPALIRIKNLAILPNSVKGDLKGCFIIAEAVGNLADERAHVRLNTLSCLSKGGQSVIDQKIKGYAVDEDGFVGLRGNVVSKMGAAIARSLLAGFVVGFGDAMNQSTVTTTTSGLGVTQSFDTSQATTAGVGKGLSQAGHDLQKMLLDLGKQAYPVVEIGTGRKLTVVISEGVDLEVKEKPNTCFGGTDKCVN